MDNTADAAHVADLERKVATYEGVLFTIASIRTTDGETLSKMYLINAVNAAKTVMGLDKRPSPYGKCPTCGANGVTRERRPNGNDKCERGHEYPSASAICTDTQGEKP